MGGFFIFSSVACGTSQLQNFFVCVTAIMAFSCLIQASSCRQNGCERRGKFRDESETFEWEDKYKDKQKEAD